MFNTAHTTHNLLLSIVCMNFECWLSVSVYKLKQLARHPYVQFWKNKANYICSRFHHWNSFPPKVDDSRTFSARLRPIALFNLVHNFLSVTEPTLNGSTMTFWCLYAIKKSLWVFLRISGYIWNKCYSTLLGFEGLQVLFQEEWFMEKSSTKESFSLWSWLAVVFCFWTRCSRKLFTFQMVTCWFCVMLCSFVFRPIKRPWNKPPKTSCQNTLLIFIWSNKRRKKTHADGVITVSPTLAKRAPVFTWAIPIFYEQRRISSSIRSVFVLFIFPHLHHYERQKSIVEFE